MKNWLRTIGPQSFQNDILKVSGLSVVVFAKKGVASTNLLCDILNRLAGGFKEEVAFFTADVEQCPEIASRYHIFRIPATLIFLEGNLVDQFNGVMSAGKIKERLEGLLKETRRKAK